VSTSRPSKIVPHSFSAPPLEQDRKPFKWKKQTRPMKQGKSTTSPTAEEKRWMEAIAAYGCIVCHQQFGCFREGEIHHLLSGGIRKGHLFTICLCAPGHHRDALPGLGMVSRHPARANFERRYGTEAELLEQTRIAIGWKGAEA
jgi:hypothetical protein